MKQHVNSLKQVAAAIVIPMLLLGCGAGKTSQPDPFFDKWRAEAEATRGYSPRVLEQEDIEAEAADRHAAVPDIEPGIETLSLPKTPVTLSMHDTPLVSVLRALARAADQSIMISDSVTGTANLSAEGTPWDSVFLGMVSTYGLVYEWDGDMLRVKTTADLDKEREKETAELRRRQLDRQQRETEDFETEIFFIRYANAASLGKVMEALAQADSEASRDALSGDSASSDNTRRATVTVDEASNAIVVHASRGKIEQMGRIITELDRPTRQVLIEAKIVETSQDTARALGIQWGGLSYEENGNSLNWIGGPTGDFDGSLFTESVRDEETGEVTYAGGDSIIYQPGIGNIVNLPADLTDSLGMTLGYQLQNLSSDYILTMQLTALQESGELNILSSPSITTLDNQVAAIESGREVPYQTVDNEGNINIEFKKAVLSLRVTPHIIDGETLRLKVVTHKDELDFTNDVEGNPTVITKNAETNVILFNGQTMVIGGLSKETATNTESGVPVLKDIPLLGYLFRSTGRTSDMEEVIIFITPHILENKPEGDEPRNDGKG